MYEYKCSNESCNQVWTIGEGDISTLYLTCPYCKKGRGAFLRQVRSDIIHEDIAKLALREPNKDYADIKSEDNIDSKIQELEGKSNKKQQKTKTEKPKEVKQPRKRQKPKVEVNVSEPENQGIKEDDIFERIRKKRQQEEEFTKDCGEDIDILEVSGDSVEEIERRVKEFEEYYYIKVLDKSIQQQGKRYNCIIKYCRK